jgi:hypothetical protein
MPRSAKAFLLGNKMRAGQRNLASLDAGVIMARARPWRG